MVYIFKSTKAFLFKTNDFYSIYSCTYDRYLVNARSGIQDLWQQCDFQQGN
jgi:hypothetical protein